MSVINSFPINDGYRMPGEFEPHSGCILIWPFRGDSWPHGGRAARKIFCELVSIIASSEDVLVCVAPGEQDKAAAMLPAGRTFIVETDDSWARDYAPTFVSNGSSLRGINWEFNAWGGEYDGLYDSWDRDNALAPALCRELGIDMYNAGFVMEGGAFHTDGEGTVITTESCLLSPGRNPQLSKAEIEHLLCSYLHCSKVIWLPLGIIDDETNGHVDNLCAFTAPGKVVLSFPEDPADPQYKSSAAALDILGKERDAKGRIPEVTLLPMPKPALVTEYECAGLDLLNGQPVRHPGERLAASYANFYISNSTVIVPGFNDENDETARRILEKQFPDREVVTLQSRDFLIGGGNFHCITQQIPKV